jgi:hypothetical protein
LLLSAQLTYPPAPHSTSTPPYEPTLPTLPPEIYRTKFSPPTTQ